MLETSRQLPRSRWKDSAAARRFYEGTLGLAVEETEGSEAVTFRTGGSRLIVYRSQFAGSNRATAVNWPVGGDLEAIVRKLGKRGSPSSTTTSPASPARGTFMPRDR